MDRYLLLAVGSLVGLGIGIGVLGQRISTAGNSPMPCHEDEVLAWVDAPNLARCVPLDDFVSIGRGKS